MQQRARLLVTWIANIRTHGALVFVLGLIALSCSVDPQRLIADDRPNFLWISCEDISPHLHCYGHPRAITPNLDQLARRGIRYTNAFTTCPVCATNRSSIITGMYPTTIGTHYMRCSATLPDDIKFFTEYFRAAGYFCTNNSKKDYNFQHAKSAWDQSSDEAHWRQRDPDQPFFHVRNFVGTHESRNWPRQEAHQDITRDLKPDQRQQPEALTLPPYYPDTLEVRRDWANYYENITQLDHHVARLLKQLDEDGLSDKTIVVFWSDHGVGLPRGKRWLYDSGTRVPLIVHIPETFRVGDQGESGTVSDELVSFVDLAPTMLNLAGLKIPQHLQGRAFLGPDLSPRRRYVYSVRDRMDERYDVIRSVRDRRYRYTRNYMPWKPYAQVLNYAERNETMKALRRFDRENRLPPAANLFMARRKPVEELYDTQLDPHEINNLAESTLSDHQSVLQQMRAAHHQWMVETRDLGLMPEPIVVERERELGSRYAILRQPEHQKTIGRIRRLVTDVTRNDITFAQLKHELTHSDPAIRYWATVGYTLKLRFAAYADESKTGTTPKLVPREVTQINQALLSAAKDTHALVRVAAAEGLCVAGRLDLGLPILIRELDDPNPWVNLYAVIALDEVDPKTQPSIEAFERAAKSAKNNYVARVAQRALQMLPPGQP